ncbi:MAG: hypothetical protein JWM96_1033, partial [Alphaproteobacteria bacterium]|nr:hypothetical protein [Alphaproteobacteria bacterium]
MHYLTLNRVTATFCAIILAFTVSAAQANSGKKEE